MVTDETGTLVDKYTVVLGLSRRWTMYELAELIEDPTAEFFDPGEDKYGDMWVGVRNTTVDDLREQLPRLQALLAEVESKARVIEEAEAVAGEGHAALQRTEFDLRRKVLSEINVLLAPEREPRTE
jgi:hypothetical protein